MHHVETAGNPLARLPGLQKIIEKNTQIVEESKGEKEQVVETTCGSHEKTSKDNFYKIRGSRPLD
jgi:hypothetical protein